MKSLGVPLKRAFIQGSAGVSNSFDACETDLQLYYLKPRNESGQQRLMSDQIDLVLTLTAQALVAPTF